MPGVKRRRGYRSRTSVRKRRKFYRVKRRARKRTVVVPKNLFANKMIQRMKYHEGFTISTTAGSPNQYFFSCNSIYDPNRSAAGHQPRGRDQMALFYQNYVVLKSQIFVQVKAPLTTDEWVIALSIQPNIITYPGDATSMFEGRNSYYKTFSGNATFPAQRKLSMKWNYRHMTNKYEKIMSEYTNDPGDEEFFCISVSTTGGGASSGNCSFQVLVLYTVMSAQPKAVAAS